jgi:hypothetical protein
MSDTSKPTDRFSQSVKIENTKPAGGYIPPSSLKHVPPKPAPKSTDYSDYKRN